MLCAPRFKCPQNLHRICSVKLSCTVCKLTDSQGDVGRHSSDNSRLIPRFPARRAIVRSFPMPSRTPAAQPLMQELLNVCQLGVCCHCDWKQTRPFLYNTIYIYIYHIHVKKKKKDMKITSPLACKGSFCLQRNVENRPNYESLVHNMTFKSNKM